MSAVNQHIPSLETPESVPTNPQLDTVKLFDVAETNDGGFEVSLPGMIDTESDLIIGNEKKRFATKEEADQAADTAREQLRIQQERNSLAKTFTDSFYRIDPTPDGKFSVTLPGLADSETGHYVGTASTEFTTWDEAKNFYLSTREQDENLTHNPILELQTADNEKVAFSDFDSFNPRVAPSEHAHEIPSSIQTFVMKQEKVAGTHPSAGTYQETIKEKDWDSKLYTFVDSYLQGKGATIFKELGIKHLDSLTPRQSVELSTRIVIELSKYDMTSDQKQPPDQALKPQKTRADLNTAQQLLREGQSMQGMPNWEGNGVCRNFASTVKAVFEALKMHQTKFNQLRDTHCLFEEGHDDAFAPKRKKRNSEEVHREGHAWNTFITVSRTGSANATIVDATWAKRDLETRKVTGLDHTLTRMEPAVHEIGKSMGDASPQKTEQLSHILSYYALKMERPGGAGGSRTADQEKPYLASRALELLSKQGIPDEIPPGLCDTLTREYEKISPDADPSEIETLWKISQKHPQINISRILKGYLNNKQLDDYHAPDVLFRDDELQKKVFEEIKQRPEFEQFLKTSPKFRVRTREVVPPLFIGFSPETKPEDAQELIYLVQQSQYLNRYGHLLNRLQPSADQVTKLFARARQTLAQLNPLQYDTAVSQLENYSIIKNYDKLYRELHGTSKQTN